MAWENQKYRMEWPNLTLPNSEIKAINPIKNITKSKNNNLINDSIPNISNKFDSLFNSNTLQQQIIVDLLLKEKEYYCLNTLGQYDALKKNIIDKSNPTDRMYLDERWAWLIKYKILIEEYTKYLNVPESLMMLVFKWENYLWDPFLFNKDWSSAFWLWQIMHTNDFKSKFHKFNNKLNDLNYINESNVKLFNPDYILNLYNKFNTAEINLKSANTYSFWEISDILIENYKNELSQIEISDRLKKSNFSDYINIRDKEPEDFNETKFNYEIWDIKFNPLNPAHQILLSTWYMRIIIDKYNIPERFYEIALWYYWTWMNAKINSRKVQDDFIDHICRKTWKSSSEARTLINDYLAYKKSH